MRSILLFLIRLYQKTRPFRPACCRFYPSCSSYAYTCLQKHGICRGLILASWRVLRCQPFAKSGIDEVPENFSLSSVSSFVSKRV